MVEQRQAAPRRANKNREEEAKGIDVIQMCLTESSLKEETAVNPIRCRITVFMVIKDVRDLRGKSGFLGFQAMQLWASSDINMVNIVSPHIVHSHDFKTMPHPLPNVFNFHDL
ncbi:hypothetical protein HPP92_011849 [Vanilla planifolia]|uniref:Uncharacterized protein n=1 Tax=Vanilla planifolia TaxID=51239 RepID=A0A835R1F6_VANPL|nr:hypothetical protein HPP92_011849 [Vanilla planifolia]